MSTQVATSVRLFERVRDFRKALVRLREALAAPKSDLARDASIQRFEFTFELGWKAMKLYLEFKGIDVRNARDALREALAQGLINDGNAWTQLLDTRNQTSHTYDEKLADTVYAILASPGVDLFDALEAELTRRTQAPDS